LYTASATGHSVAICERIFTPCIIHHSS
jgi:hypothetical protein